MSLSSRHENILSSSRLLQFSRFYIYPYPTMIFLRLSLMNKYQKINVKWLTEISVLAALESLGKKISVLSDLYERIAFPRVFFLFLYLPLRMEAYNQPRYTDELSCPCPQSKLQERIHRLVKVGLRVTWRSNNNQRTIINNADGGVLYRGLHFFYALNSQNYLFHIPIYEPA